MQNPSALPLSVYVHIPWCVRKCPYCDFNSHAVSGAGIPERAYLNALRADLEASLPLVWGRSVGTVFFGGGTPSMFSVQAIDEIMAMLRSLLKMQPDAEVTLEANPGAVDQARFAGFASAGVNRVSIGVQSFNSEHLKALGRVHDADGARRAADTAQKHFKRVNLDLMFGLPNQSIAQCESDLQTALSFGTEHLSLYQLTMEPNTVFAQHPPDNLPDDDLLADMQDLVHTQLAAHGLEQYEVSAYARAGAQCRHNLNYWQFGDYLGIGAGAHGKLTLHDRILRTNKIRHPQSYMEQALKDSTALGQVNPISSQDIGFEFMLNALRLKEGVSSDLYEMRTRQSLARISKGMTSALDKGLLDANPARLKASPLGWKFLNDLQSEFLNAPK